MTVLDWFKTLWPVALALAAFGIRVEVGQALNKQRLRSIERDIEREKEDRKSDLEGVHARMSRHETDIRGVLGEIRQDIKHLLSRP